MANTLKDQIAIITAAGQGIGRATAEQFISEGAKVFATDINKELLEDLDGCEIRTVDVCDELSVKKVGKL